MAETLTRWQSSEFTALTAYREELTRIPVMPQRDLATLIVTRDLAKAAQNEYEQGKVSRSNRGKLRKTIETWQKARTRIYEGNLRLPFSFATKYALNQPELMDFIQEGNIGLGKAIDRYDVSRGVQFSTYALWQVRAKIWKYLGKEKYTMLEFQEIEYLVTYNKIQKELWASLGRTPTLTECAAKIKISPTKLREVLWAKRKGRPSSLDAMIVNANGDESPVVETIADKSTDVEGKALDRVHSTRISMLVQPHLDQLDSRSKFIIEARFGIGYPRPLTLEETSKLLKPATSRQRIKQLQDAALSTLQSNSSLQGLHYEHINN